MLLLSNTEDSINLRTYKHDYLSGQQGIQMIKIITPALLFMSVASPSGMAADNSVLSPNSLYDLGAPSYGAAPSVGFIGRYDVGFGLESRDQTTSYDLFDSDDDEQGNAWVGVASKQSQLRVGRHDSIDRMATVDADQHKVDGAYDLIMRGDDIVPNSMTYVKSAGAFAVGAQYAEGESDDSSDSIGLILNTKTGPYEASIAYRQTPENSKAIKGRVTYKSRNNSRIRVDLVAEKFAVGDVQDDEPNANSTSFMVGAKYNMTPKAYVVGQYGSVGFDAEGLPNVRSDLSRDYSALSLEAGYNLTESTSIYVNHTQKSYDSSSLLAPFADDDDGSQTNSIGVRLNW